MPLNIKYLPVYTYKEEHHLNIKASPEQIMKAVLNYSANDDSLFRYAIALREFPKKLFYKEKRSEILFGLDHFTLLEQLDHQEVIWGLVGQFWKADYGLVNIPDGSSFLEFQHENHAKLTLYFSIQKIDEEYTCLTTETRVFCIDRKALLKFRPYWYLIRPVSGWIRRRLLLQIQKNIQNHI
ncbi:hypothetical protein [Acinetobacter boissieri]|uniref:DUF2867 domain-containing protein n=1 Tax=Acinetobacter boissieri TaxID=1219383 RepID=A0A1G6H832_9GAMM|nr:hypothetical protein [Acinetobacter boissieri]SDB90105.1 hypothetical protein SAMN05421733_104103 [Acinetobacter boissieri]